LLPFPWTIYLDGRPRCAGFPGRPQADLPRSNLVFQNGARCFPEGTIHRNVSFGPIVQGPPSPGKEIDPEKARFMLGRIGVRISEQFIRGKGGKILIRQSAPPGRGFATGGVDE